MLVLLLAACTSAVHSADTSAADTADSAPPVETCTCDHVCGVLTCSRCGGCDDSDPFVGPGCAEVCDGIDNNCDGLVDEGVGTAYSPDSDGDGWGADSGILEACEPPGGYAAAAGDCDDATATISPAALETCNTLDDDCDGVIDEDCPG